MKISHVAAALAIGAVTASASLLGTGTAAAGPLDGALLDSTCSFAQIDRALHAEHPDLAAKLDAHPDRKAALARVFDQPPAQRKAALQQLIAAHPDKVAQARQMIAQHPDQAAKARDVVNQLANTCHRF
jgi:hemophore-related protein